MTAIESAAEQVQAWAWARFTAETRRLDRDAVDALLLTDPVHRHQLIVGKANDFLAPVRDLVGWMACSLEER